MLGIVDQDIETQHYAEHPNAEFLARSRWFGRSTWRVGQRLSNPLATIQHHMQRQGDAWPPLKAGLFGNDLARARETVDRFEADFNKVARNRW